MRDLIDEAKNQIENRWFDYDYHAALENDISELVHVLVVRTMVSLFHA